MSAAAIIMMLIALILVWGGLVAALLHLRKNPEDLDVVEQSGRAEVPPST